MNCKKSGCDFRDILMASGIVPGYVEVDQMVLQAADQQRREQRGEEAVDVLHQHHFYIP